MSRLTELKDELERLTGNGEFVYSTQPSPTGPTRYVFQHGRNFLRYDRACEYLELKIEQAKTQAGTRGA